MRRLLFLCSLLVLAACQPPPPPMAAAPPPPAPPPVLKPQHFTVYFDYNSAQLSPVGEQIAEQAAAAFNTGTVKVVHVNGFTDRSGSDQYNADLSVARAGAVVDALEKHGVPDSRIVMAGFGEKKNAVPTADGVREPRNRRVEIIEIRIKPLNVQPKAHKPVAG